jgi:tRNA-splicing ligase RtcB (3'-phosphate/5'-hydroxy nucleic acid ligase)
MAEQATNYEWRGEGEEAEIVLYAPDSSVANQAFEQALPAARLPGVVNPVYAAASSGTLLNLGWVAASETHVAPELISAPERGLLLLANASVEEVGVPEEVPRQIGRKLSEIALPNIGDAEVREVVESGAFWATEEGLIEEEDLSLLSVLPGDADSVGRRALSAGSRDWMRPGSVRAFQVAEILNPEGAEALGLEVGALALVVRVGAEDLGRLSLASHYERISTRASSEEFGALTNLPAAPTDTEEAKDLMITAHAAANYAAGRATLFVYALRRALGDVGGLHLRAAWAVGGLEERDGRTLHRNDLVVLGDGEVLVAGIGVAAGTGAMLGSAPPFEAPEREGHWAWEEAGVLERWATLGPLGRSSGEVGG